MQRQQGTRHRGRREGGRGEQKVEKSVREDKGQRTGVIAGCCNKLLYMSAIAGLSLVFFLTLKSSPVDPEAFRLPPPRPWSGPLAVNTDLQKGRRIAEGKIIGPESMALKDGRIYTGTMDGKVVEISNDEDVRVIARLGGSACAANGGDEKTCGRPLGTRFVEDKLHVIDAFLGLYQVDQTGVKQPFQLLSTQKVYGGHTMKFANDFERLANGTFLLSDTSYKWHMTEYGLMALENKASGRLLWYNPDNKESGVVYEGLYSPNGIQLSPNEDFLLIAESIRYRVMKYHLTGPKKGTAEVFVDNLPGMPDNISPSSSGGYWIAFALANSRMLPMKMDLLAPLPWLRKMVAKLVDPTPLVPYLPQYGLIVEVDQMGRIVRSLHDPSGKVVEAVSEVLDTGDTLYLGSYFSPFLVKLNMK
ncbi:adipocyte plasma membrane-associated protein-like isoform X1 [Diadema antillarum]|uniref:adipocyte plasma membrane-associated protein-like isoform X1 n=1 Tax=Diadema antillarum TaxID=105358 RepID=UPI003A8350A4